MPSKTNASAIGMMEGAFFVGRSELLGWVNQWLRLNVSKVEECASGAVYCQIIDSVHPGKVKMQKVNWKAKTDHEFIPNYKLLQQSFIILGVQRHIDVNKLIKGKYQDNLEFLQWLKCYFDKNYGGTEYAAQTWRPTDNNKLSPWAVFNGGDDAAPIAWTHNHEGHGGPSAAVENAPRPRDEPAPRQRVRPVNNNSKQKENVMAVGHKEEVEDLRIALDGLANERDYYFQKLRDIEILTQTLEGNPNPNLSAGELVETIQKILYKEEDYSKIGQAL